MSRTLNLPRARSWPVHSMSSSSTMSNLVFVDESGEEVSRPTPMHEPTPLPRFQLFTVMMAQMTEQLSGTVIYPFMPQMVARTGIINGDEKKTGYYTGILGSVFFLTEFSTVHPWARASDYFGRKPILALGPLGLSIATLGFGLSTNFWMLLVFRAMQGVFNGNMNVAMTIIAELSDATNAARAFGLVPITIILGSFGVLIGGICAEPETQWPNTLGKIALLRRLPYFLPCFVVSVIAFVAFLFVALGLRETRQSVTKGKGVSTTLEAEPLIPRSDTTPEVVSLTTPVKLLFKSKVFVLTLVNYACLATGDMVLQTLIPLFYSSPLKDGGLEMSPLQIGIVVALACTVAFLVQVFVYPPMQARLGGPKGAFFASMILVMISLCTFPVMSFCARRKLASNNAASSWDGAIWICVIVQLLTGSFVNPGTSALLILIARHAGSSETLASANSIAEMTAVSMRVLTPTLASSLFAFSAQHDASMHGFGRYLCYIVLVAVQLAGVVIAVFLPE